MKKPHKYRKLISDRSHPELTVELADKWYTLWASDNEGNYEPLLYGALEPLAALKQTSAYRDHCPNPEIVELYAEVHGYLVPELAMELITGRWIRESSF